MGVIIRFRTQNSEGAPDSTPRRIFRDGPPVEIEVESLVPLTSGVIPYVWVRGDALDAFERTLVADPALSEVTLVEAAEGGALYSVVWEVDSPVIQCLSAAGGALVDANGTVERWDLTILFDDDEAVSSFHRCCRESDFPFEVEAVRSFGDAVSAGGVVSEAQREAIAVAHEKGYFELPRTTSQREIAAELDVTPTAVGDRLRRGIANVVETHVIE